MVIWEERDKGNVGRKGVGRKGSGEEGNVGIWENGNAR